MEASSGESLCQHLAESTMGEKESGVVYSAFPYDSLPNGSVDVLNDTADLHRFFDCTEEAEFPHECARRAAKEDLPREIDHLKNHDEAMRAIMSTIEMPDDPARRIIALMRGNAGRFPNRRRGREPFSRLFDDEIRQLEEIVGDAFDGAWR